MSYFLVVYDRKNDQMLRIAEFADHERLDALRAHVSSERERLGSANLEDVEVVLLSSPSIDVLRRTHSRYFRRLEDYGSSQVLKEAATG